MDEDLPDTHLFSISMVDDYFATIPEFLASRMAPAHYIVAQEKKLVVKALDYQLISGQLYKMGPDETLRHCVFDHEKASILEEAHADLAVGYYAGRAIAQNILRARLWWPTLHKDAKEYCQNCDVC